MVKVRKVRYDDRPLVADRQTVTDVIAPLSLLAVVDTNLETVGKQSHLPAAVPVASLRGRSMIHGPGLLRVRLGSPRWRPLAAFPEI
jgi:hypothetical protein